MFVRTVRGRKVFSIWILCYTVTPNDARPTSEVIELSGRINIVIFEGVETN